MVASTFLETVRNGHVLVVDDELTTLSTIRAILTYQGFLHVETLSDPRRAPDRFFDWDCDLMLLDLHMPSMNGYQVLETLMERRGGDYLPVIVLTGDDDEKTRIRVLESGAKDYIAKPVQTAELIHRMGNVMTASILLKQQRQTAQSLENAVRLRTAELEESRTEIIQALARAGEYRDNETGHHVTRMSCYCYLLARAAGYGRVFCQTLLQASPMHDVGKIGVPDSILRKPGPLDADEHLRMCDHTTIGARILGENDCALLAMARSVALTHHERWDGGGYPAGLAGTAIPPEGRIAAICDVFDALTSRRPYKRAWTVDEALNALHDGAGSHFDAELVAHFAQLRPYIEAVISEFQDVGHHTLTK